MKKSVLICTITFVFCCFTITGVIVYYQHKKAKEQEEALKETMENMNREYNRLNREALEYEYEKYGGFKPVYIGGE